MDNVIKFPKKELDIEVNFDSVDVLLRHEERVRSLVDVMDLNAQGTFHVMDVDAEEIMMALLHMSALWAFRAGLEPEQYYEVRDSMLVEVDDGTKST